MPSASEVEPQLLKGVLTLLLLSLLAHEEDYGYSVVQRLRGLGLAGVGEGTVYPALTRLEGRGLLAARVVPAGRGPARRYYRTTATGLAELDRLLVSWHTVGAVVARTTHVTSSAAGGAPGDTTHSGRTT